MPETVLASLQQPIRMREYMHTWENQSNVE